ncbi:MAG: protein kinase family protein [Clostridiaceae bacterium]
MVLSLFNRDVRLNQGDLIHEYIVEEILGEGRYGICYLVSKDNKKYILKQLKKKMLKKSGDKVFFEKKILKKLNYPNIPKYIETIKEDNIFAFILEFIEGKTIERIIFEDDYVFDKSEIKSIGNQVINIVKYLHENGIVHRDIRVPNTIFRDGQIYLVDFGLARYINEEKYTIDVDFSYIGDFLLHLYYTSFDSKEKKERPWYEELTLEDEEMLFLKRLFGIEKTYNSIYEVEEAFKKLT